MKLYQKVSDDVKKAMKAQDVFLLGTLRLVFSALKYKVLDKKGELTDEESLKIINHEAKKRKDAILAYTKGGRPELAEKEKKELTIISQYLPKQLSEAEVAEKIKIIVKQNSQLDFGPLMGKAMAELKGQAEGSLVQKILKQQLSK